jgi:hypothetical protein
MANTVVHAPTAPYRVWRERDTFVVIAACACGGDCAMTATVYSDRFYTPDGDPWVPNKEDNR